MTIARSKALLVFFTACLCSGLTPFATSSAAAEGLLAVGSPAPDVVGEDAAGKPVKLSEQKGKLAVVYFYPKDGTSGCTKQADGFRDAFDELTSAGVVVFGVSRDSA